MLGVLVAEKAVIGRMIVTIAFAGYLLIPLLYRRTYLEFIARGAALAMAFLVGAGALWYGQRQWECETAGLLDGQTVTVCGNIVRKQYTNGEWRYELQPDGCRYRVLVCEPADDDQKKSLEQNGYPLGSVLEVKGNFQFFTKPSNEGQFNEFLFQKSKGNIGRIYDARIEQICFASKVSGWREQLFVLRRRLCLVYEQNLSQDESGILASMAAGERTLLSSDIRDTFQQAGLSHILAISGMHIQMIGMTIFLTLRKRSCPYHYAAIASAVVLLLYGGMIELGVSSIRAIGMFFIYLVASCLGRRYDAYGALSVLVMALVLTNPFVLHQTGFIFSCYAAFCAIIISAALREDNAKKNRLFRALKIPLLLQLFTLPLVAYFYYEIPLYALFFNLILLPYLGVVIGVGLVGGMVGFVFPALAGYLLFPVHMILSVYLWMCDLGERLPCETVICGKPGLVKISVYALGLWRLFRLFSSDEKRIKHKKKKLNIPFRQLGAYAVITALLLTVLLYVPKGAFEIDFLDVGQGDGIYLHTQEGVDLFIDGGSSSISKVGAYRILPFLKYKGVRKIDYWFLSHPDADHISGVLDVIQAGYPIGTIITGVRSENAPQWEELLALCGEHHIVVREMYKEDVLRFEKTCIRCLHPSANYETDNLNNASLVLLYEMPQFRAVFGGDIPSEVEWEILKNPMQQVNLVKANHHGSKYSNSEAWLDALSPEAAVISCGRDNRYGHPNRETLERMAAVECEFFRTDELGQLRICISRGRMAVFKGN